MQGTALAYSSALALFLGASATLVGLIATLPPLSGAVGQMCSVYATDRISKRRPLLVFGAFAQAMLLAAAAILPWFFYPGELAPLVLLTVLLFSFFSEGLTGPVWSSLIGDVIPPDIRGQFFGLRNRYVSIYTLISMLSAGMLLDLGKRADFTQATLIIIFLFASFARFKSARWLSQYEEPQLIKRPEDSFSFWQFISRTRHSNFAKFVVFLGCMNLAFNISGPYYSVFMLRDMQLSYWSFTIITSTAVISQFSTMRMWGKLVDSYGAKKILNLSLSALVFSPAFWLVSSNFWYILSVQLYSGFFWAGFRLSSSTFIFDAVTPAKRARCAGYQAFIEAICVFVGALLGSAILAAPDNWLPHNVGLWSTESVCTRVFLASFLGRALVVLLLLRVFKEVRDVPGIGYKALCYQIINFRPLSGMRTRMVDSNKSNSEAKKDNN